MPIYSLPGFYEPVASITHLVGAVVFALLGVALLWRARGNRLRVFFLSIYVVCSVFLLAMSGVYHMLAEGTTTRNVLGRLDYAAIFTLIAGTYTPVHGLFFRGFWRIAPLAFMWSAVATGIPLLSVYYHDLPQGLGIAVFLGLGWIAGASGVIVWRRFGTSAMALLVGGGVAYSVGAILMGIGWPTIIPGVVGPHEIWHLAVLAAMAMHWKFLSQHARLPTTGPVPIARARAVVA